VVRRHDKNMIKLLKENEFRKSISNPAELKEGYDRITTNFWEYYDEISKNDFKGISFSNHEVSNIYRMDNDYDHILISAETHKNIFLVLVNDHSKNIIIGHYILDLNKEYGLK
ncbi:hypothetical protein, partial [Leptospira venezuelensis]|uniref:hypothetical protein n=2 Tax=Leptospira venezuelensis TaxID=1958811 RepID=UPI000A3CA935